MRELLSPKGRSQRAAGLHVLHLQVPLPSPAATGEVTSLHPGATQPKAALLTPGDSKPRAWKLVPQGFHSQSILLGCIPMDWFWHHQRPVLQVVGWAACALEAVWPLDLSATGHFWSAVSSDMSAPLNHEEGTESSNKQEPGSFDRGRSVETPSPWQDTLFFEPGLLCLAGDPWLIAVCSGLCC